MTVNSKGFYGQPIIQNPPTRIADMTAIADYAALVGNRIVDTASNRVNFTTHFGFTPFPGLEYFELGTGNIYIYSGSTWIGVKPQSGLVSFTGGTGAPVTGGYAWSQGVTFATGRFSFAPVVTTGIFTGSGDIMHAGVQNVTATGFTLTYVRATNTSTTIGWTATPADS